MMDELGRENMTMASRAADVTLTVNGGMAEGGKTKGG